MPPKQKPQKTKATKEDDPEPEVAKPTKKAKTNNSDKEEKTKNGAIDFEALPKVKPPNVKAFKEFEAGQPAFSDQDYEVVKNCLLQVTDIKDNHNKFYSLELHLAPSGAARLFTHYGRTDDLNRFFLQFFHFY